ncbi:MAG: SPOR domain-containing protein [Zoogloeaceae bacterium]|jgi:cell division protein FtsN|nr:SPOR domain-containing protein [Zoogloeaceae bacterium]
MHKYTHKQGSGVLLTAMLWTAMLRTAIVQRTVPRRLRNQSGGTLVGIFVGLVLGVLISTGVVWYLNKMPVPFVSRVQPAPETKGQRPLDIPGKPGDSLPQPPRAPATPTAPADASTPADSSAPADPSAAPPGAVPPVDSGDASQADAPQAARNHYLQAGSFSRPEEADRARANLAMKGLEARVEQVMVQEKTYYRVLLGPYDKTGEAGKVRAELAQAGIDAIPIVSE